MKKLYYIDRPQGYRVYYKYADDLNITYTRIREDAFIFTGDEEQERAVQVAENCGMKVETIEE